MPDFSQPPLTMLVNNRAKGYVGLHVEQGVPVLDRDLNLLNDLVSATVRSVVTRYLGNGTPIGAQGFSIVAIPAANDFRIVAGPAGVGSALVGGIEVTITGDILYSAQPGVPGLTTPTAAQPNPRNDIVYLDVFIRDVEFPEDGDLSNLGDVGMQTSVRQKPEWVLLVAEGVAVPPPAPGHVLYELARLTRPLNDPNITAPMITDLRDPMSPLTVIEQRLRAVEVLLLLPAFGPPGGQFQPVIGVSMTPVTLFGTNFNVGGIPTVQFGSVSAPVLSATASEIHVTVPTGIPSGTYSITVTTASGQAVSTDPFQVLVLVPPPPPAFAASGGQFSPVIGTTNTPVLLMGSNFDAGGTPTVLLDGVAATINGAVTATQIPVLVPAGLSPGPKAITVTTSGGTVISTDTFMVL